MYATFVKPILDKVLALLAWIVLSPLFVVIAVAIKCDSKGPAVFRQERLGKDGRLFWIYKFRTMIDNASEQGAGVFTYAGDPRITRVGAFLRKTSLDETLQVLNILKGEMSFIGPRPFLANHPKPFDKYSETEKLRFTVKPGISGLAQLRCREINDWRINLPIDVEYVKTLRFINDLKLFLRSLTVFFRSDNIYSPDDLNSAKDEERRRNSCGGKSD